jgi:ATP-dependent helicase/nuclease subunit A
MSDARTRAVSDLATDFAVIAGAGSGKTTALVDRFVSCATETGGAPGSVLALTFTEKAAAEMKERIIRRFTDARDERRRRETEAAYISTIHGFAARLLKENPFAAGVDPAFTVLTDFEQALLAEEGLRAMYADPALGAYAERLGRTFEGGWRIFELAREVSRRLREATDATRRESDLVLAGRDDEVVAEAARRVEAWAADRRSQALALLRRLRPGLEQAPFTSKGKMFEQKETYVAAARATIEAGVWDPRDEVWDQTRFTSQIPAEERGPIRDALSDIKDIARAVRALDPAYEKRLERELIPLKRAIYGAARGASEGYQAEKRARAALDYHDLQLLALALLERSPEVRARYAESFRHILLDEAQDTDELQHELIGRLRTERNHRFLVGDPKQAIYEFRGANPDVFDAAVEQLPEADRLRFDENFRSRPELLDFVNAFGEALLPGRYAPLVARADYAAVPFGGPHVESVHVLRGQLPPPPDDEDARPTWEALADVRRREAAVLADRIATLLREKPKVLDPDRPQERHAVPLRPRHIALLFRSRGTIPYFEHAFAARSIPYVTAVGEGFYERTEVLDCLMMLRKLEQPLDDLALASVLKSPFWGASDSDLLRVRGIERGRRPQGRKEERPLYPYLGELESLAPFRAAFDALRARTWGRPAGEALDDALRTFRYEAALASHPDGRAMLANVAKLRRQLAHLGAATVAEALRELEKARALLLEERQAPLLGPADDVVVFTTIHQAKGLEWPVVCLPNFQGTLPIGRRPLFSARHGLLLLKALDSDEEVLPLSVRPLMDELRRRAEAEERRLLYVALTRARERLILTCSVKPEAPRPAKKNDFPSYFAFFADTLGPHFLDEGAHAVGSSKIVVRRVVGPPPEPVVLSEGRPLLDRIEPAAAAHPASGESALPAAAPSSVKVTELLAYARCPLVHRFAIALDIPEHPPRRAALRVGAAQISAVDRGTIVHRLLERADLSADAAVESRRLADGEDEAIRGDLRRMLSGVLGGEVGNLVRRAARVERELPLAMMVDGVELSGVIDLAVQAPGGAWTVLDYKSNDISRAGRLEQLVRHYRPQLELYALAMERAGLGDVSHCALVFLNGPEVRRWPFEDADAARAEETARGLLRGIVTADYRTEPGPKCAQCGYRKRRICAVGQGWSA